MLNEERDNLAEAVDQLGQIQRAGRRLGQPDQGSTGQGAQSDVGPVLESLANAGPGADPLAELRWPPSRVRTRRSTNGSRGDYANLTAIIDLTLSRLDNGLFTGTRWEGNLTELEMQWGRTIGQMPSPYTAAQSAGRSLSPRSGAVTCI